MYMLHFQGATRVSLTPCPHLQGFSKLFTSIKVLLMSWWQPSRTPSRTILLALKHTPFGDAGGSHILHEVLMVTSACVLGLSLAGQLRKSNDRWLTQPGGCHRPFLRKTSVLTEKGKVVLASQACRSGITFQDPQNPSAALVLNLQWRVHPYFWLNCLWSLLKQQAVIKKKAEIVVLLLSWAGEKRGRFSSITEGLWTSQDFVLTLTWIPQFHQSHLPLQQKTFACHLPSSCMGCSQVRWDGPRPGPHPLAGWCTPVHAVVIRSAGLSCYQMSRVDGQQTSA